MKTILLIGLGRFGKNVAMKLHELNHEVMAIDRKEDRVEEVLPYVTNAQIGDSMGCRNSKGWISFVLCSISRSG